MIVRRQKHILFLSQRGYPNKKKRATASKTIKRRFRSDIFLGMNLTGVSTVMGFGHAPTF